MLVHSTTPTDKPAMPTVISHPAETSANDRLWFGIAIAAGMALRFTHYFSNRSFMLDEALLAQNVCARGFLELMQPLVYDQGAPLGFLWLLKLCTLAFGDTEYAMRLVPLVSSLTGLGLIASVGRRLLNPAAAIVSTALLAVSPMMVYYAAEAKQYALDATVSLLILHVAARYAERPRASRGAILLIVGSFAIWLSHPAAFVLAATGVWLLTVLPVRTSRYLVMWAVAIASAWSLSFLANYFQFLRPLSRNSGLTDYWQYAFLRVPPRSGADLQQYVSVLVGLFELTFGTRSPADFTGPRTAILGLVMWVAGLVAIGRRDPRTLWLLLLPFAIVVACATFGKYPARDRLILFFVPMVVLAMSAAVAELFRHAERAQRQLGMILLGGMLVLPTLYGLNSFLRPRHARKFAPGWSASHAMRNRATTSISIGRRRTSCVSTKPTDRYCHKPYE